MPFFNLLTKRIRYGLVRAGALRREIINQSFIFSIFSNQTGELVRTRDHIFFHSAMVKLKSYRHLEVQVLKPTESTRYVDRELVEGYL